MKNILEKVFVRSIIFVLALILFLLSALAQADVDTLRPTADVLAGEVSHWIDYPDAGGRWDDIDDVTSDGDDTYLYDNVNGHTYIYRSDDWSGSTIDSVKAVWFIRKAEAFNLFRVAIGRAYNEEGFWVTCGALDSVTETTQSYTLFSMMWSNDPCTDEAWSTTYLNNNSFGFGIKHAGGISAAMGRFTQAYFIVYSPEAAPADKKYLKIRK